MICSHALFARDASEHMCFCVLIHCMWSGLLRLIIAEPGVAASAQANNARRVARARSLDSFALILAPHLMLMMALGNEHRLERSAKGIVAYR